MKVLNSKRTKEAVNPFKIVARLDKLNCGLTCDTQLISDEVCRRLDRVLTIRGLWELVAETAAAMDGHHRDYATLAAKIVVAELHRTTNNSFSETIEALHGTSEGPLIAEDVYEIIKKNHEKLGAEIKHARDYQYDYIGLKTLEKSYLLKIKGKVVERPQHMLMRVAIGIHKDDIASVIDTYHLMSQRWYTHASTTLFNAGTPKPYLSSCFLACINGEETQGIDDTLKEFSVISQSGGGVGVAVNGGPNGTSSGIIPMMHLFNDTASKVKEESGRRKGDFAIYLEPWHADIIEFLDLRKKYGKEDQRARDLFCALWVPDLFMKRVRDDGSWSLFCPDEVSDLAGLCNEDFESRYIQYEKEKKAKKVMRAQELWSEILKSQMETGTPYMLFKDNCNRKSNQKNLGTIISSSMGAEIIQYSSATETAVCNLASIALPRFVRKEGDPLTVEPPPQLVGSKDAANRFFDFDKLAEVTMAVTKVLDKTIDVSDYPTESARTFNSKNRPIGIGVQGLADTFILLGLEFDSAEARELNKKIFETIYYNALKSSSELAEKKGRYEKYNGSPVSQGILQQDMWGIKPTSDNWNSLRSSISTHGIRNSLLIALMPTASTSLILGNSESFAPYASIIPAHRVSRARIHVVNKHLLHDLIEMKIWFKDLKNEIIGKDGSVQDFSIIPKELKAIYRTVWEIDQKTLIDMAVDRGSYVDQSQSLNIHMGEPDLNLLHKLHLHAWSKGLKTGMRCLRSRRAVVYV